MNASPSSHARVAYIVLTHANWPQVRRLVGAIRSSSPDAFVLIAHDARRESFPPVVDDRNVEVLQHGLETDWGTWELVEATLIAFEYVRSHVDPDLVCLVSGQDYPARRLSEWEDEALAADGWIGDASPLRYTPRWGRRLGDGDDTLTRYSHRWFQTPAARRGIRLPGRVGRAWRRVRDACALRLEPVFAVRVVERGRGVFYGLRRLRVPFSAERPCHHGSQWIAIHRPELDHLLDDDLAPTSRLRRLYKHSIIPDESALVTPLAWRGRPNSLPPVSHVEWDHARDQPAVCTLEHLDAIRTSGSPFCRKVDPVASAALMDELDRITSDGR